MADCGDIYTRTKEGITFGKSYLVHFTEHEHNVVAMADFSPRIKKWLEQEAKKHVG